MFHCLTLLLLCMGVLCFPCLFFFFFFFFFFRGVGVLYFVLLLFWSSLCPFSFCNDLAEKERDEWLINFNYILFFTWETLSLFVCALIHLSQRRNQNAEKVTHIKGRQLDQAMILFNCAPFQMGTSLKEKNLLPGERILCFMSSSL